MKLLHSADWHLDSPIQGRTEEQTALLKAALLQVPHQVCAAAKAEGCHLMLLAGDLFDGPASPESIKALRDALEEVAIPVFIAPGNHDFCSHDSVWRREVWPENVHLFLSGTMESVLLPALSCRVYGAAFTAAASDGLLEDFRAETDARYTLGVLHGDPTQASSPYCPVTAGQIRDSGLDYLALGHIHKGGSVTEGKTLCAWPGCPMGRGFDEPEQKGVLVVSLDDSGCRSRFLPLDTPRFYDWTADAGPDPASTLGQLLPPVGNRDFYRVTLTGEWEAPDTEALRRAFCRFPNLTLRDRTEPPLDIWAHAGEDSLEGVYFGLLRQQLETADENTREAILLAARISRQILENREVKLP